MYLKKAIVVLDVLKDELPACFRRGGNKQPLAPNIQESVIEHYAADSRFNKDILKKALALYVNGTKYLKSVISGHSRIDLEGNVVSKITKVEREYAKNFLESRKKNKLKHEDLAASDKKLEFWKFYGDSDVSQKRM